MKAKKLFVVTALLSGTIFTNEGYASTAVRSFVPNGLQFYVGVSGGINRMSGTRSEVVVNQLTPPPDDRFVFSNNLKFSDRNAQYSLFAGCSFDFPGYPVFIGPELYIGRAHTEHEFRNFKLNQGDQMRVLQASIQQRDFFGAVIKAGANLPCASRAFVLFGIDSAQFRYATFYIPISGVALGQPSDLPPPSFATTKSHSGFVYGFGVEKKYNDSLRVGADIRFINYRLISNANTAFSGDPATGNDSIFGSFKPKNIRFSLNLAYLF